VLSRRQLLLTTFIASLAQAKTALPGDVAGELPDARRLGSGRMTWFGLHVYDAHLWVVDGFDPLRYDAAALALELEYARSFSGRRITERSIEEMRRTGPIPAAQAEAWQARMTRIFPDVNKSDRLVGVHKPGVAARFLHNGQPIGELRDADFARRFFGIWLAPETSEPTLRRALLGEKSGSA